MWVAFSITAVWTMSGGEGGDEVFGGFPGNDLVVFGNEDEGGGR